MKKGALCLILILAAAVLAPAQQVSFKLMGGWSWINGSDYSAGIAGESGLIRAISTTASGSFANLTNGPHFQAELITHISSHVAIGLGGGYYRISNESMISYGGLAADGTTFNATSTLKPQVSVIPFFLNVHYFVALAPKMKLDVYAGPLFSIVQTHIENPGTLTTANTTTLELFTASQTSLAAQAGVGVSYQVTRRIHVLVDGSYHLGSVTNLQGNWVKNVTDTTGFTSLSSDSYYMWMYDLAKGSATYRQFGFFDANGPTGGGISNVQKAKIDISGLMLSAGVKISF